MKNNLKVIINRNNGNEKQTIGICLVFKEEKILFSAMSLERGWLNNKKRESCIPTGSYKVVLEYSPSFGKKLWEIKGVENRSECKFHSANFWYQINGCIALGQRVTDINKDGFQDVTNSKNTMVQFHKALKGETEFELIIE